MNRGRRWGGLLLLLAARLLFAGALRADTRAVPEFALFKNHNNIFRSRLAASVTLSEKKSAFTAAGLEYDLDVGLGTFFRRYVFKDPDAEKSKFVTLRLGYLYVPDLLSGDANDDEHRVLTDATVRLPLGPAWLLSDRNRAEFRRKGDEGSTRYRNRLRLERGIKVGSFRTTPYANAEFYYNFPTDTWNQTDATLGAEFPWINRTVLEFYFTWHSKNGVQDDQTIGFTFQKHL